MQTICVCGAGTMGSGIAQVAAESGFTCLLYDVNPQILHEAQSRIEKGLQLAVEKNKIQPSQKSAALDRLRFTNNPADCVGDLIIEAILEKMELKISLLQSLSKINQPQTILASNTSSLSITAMAGKIPHPGRVIGMHFFNPAPLMKLVEIVRSDLTDAPTIEKLMELARQMGKTPVLCKDAPGFIVNHVARPFYLEALRLLEQGLADIETIDRVMEGAGFKMGPFALMDLIGNDINYAVSVSVYEALDRPARLRPSFIQQSKLEKGELGRKSGKGYYEYPPA